MTTSPFTSNAALVLQLRTAERRLKEAEERRHFAEAQARMFARAADNEKAEARAWRERYGRAARQPDYTGRTELSILGTDERLAQALANVGVDLACGGCAALFYTGGNWPSDVHTCKRTVAAILANPPVAAPLAVDGAPPAMYINCQVTHAGMPHAFGPSPWYQLRVVGGDAAEIRAFRWVDATRDSARWVPTTCDGVLAYVLYARGYVVTDDAIAADPTTLTYDNPEATHEPP